jgi:hypothetical protein
MVSLVYEKKDADGYSLGQQSIITPLSEIRNTPAIKGKKIKVGNTNTDISEYYDKLAADMNKSQNMGSGAQPTAPAAQSGTQPTPAPKTGSTANPKRDAAGNTYGDGSSKDSPAPWPGKDKAIKGKWYKNSDGAVGQYGVETQKSSQPAKKTPSAPATSAVDSTAIYEKNKQALKDLFGS